jgi:hypothetical protein
MHMIQTKTEIEKRKWARREFGMSYAQWATLLALVVGYRIRRQPIGAEALESFVRIHEDRGARHSLTFLADKGYAVRGPKYGPTGQQTSWIPTSRGSALFPGPDVLREIVKTELAKCESGPTASEVPLLEVG